tara:strand:+ start:90 stop:581 length:492 start_codon:yes stop_codon:yes gene_type:complete
MIAGNPIKVSAWDEWIDGMFPELWTCFTMSKHQKGLDQRSRLEQGRKAFHNAMKTYAIRAKTHILVYAGGGIQPVVKSPHYHAIIKHLEPRNATITAKNLVFPWLSRNPGPEDKPTAYVRPYRSYYGGPSYVEGHEDSFIRVYCPKRSVRCKKNKCKGVHLFT